MGADGEKLDHRRVAHAEAVGGIEIARRQHGLIGHAAVGVDADDLEGLAAVGLSLAAGRALAAVEVGVDDHRLAVLETGAVRVEHDTRQLVPDDPRILEVRKRALEDVVVGAADADVLDADAHPARP